MEKERRWGGKRTGEDLDDDGAGRGPNPSPRPALSVLCDSVETGGGGRELPGAWWSPSSVPPRTGVFRNQGGPSPTPVRWVRPHTVDSRAHSGGTRAG